MSSPRKVLYVSASRGLGGAETFTRDLIRLHRAERWAPHIFFLRAGGDWEAEMTAEQIPVHRLSGAPPRLRDPFSVARAVREIQAVIRRESIDLVHSVMGYAHLFGGLAASRESVPRAWFQHGPTGPLDWLTGRVGADLIFVNSLHTQRLQSRFQARCGKMQLLYPSIRLTDPAPLREKAREVRDSLGVAPDDLLFGIVGRVTALKGHRLLVEAARAVRDQCPRARFVVVGGPFGPGDEGYLADLRQAVIDADLSPQFGFTGHLADPRSAILACDVVVNASLTPEGLGLSLLEGMALARPAIGPAQGGVLEVIEPGINGLLFHSGSSASLAQAIASFAASPSQMREMGEQARAGVARRYAPAAMITRVEDEYDALSARRADRRRSKPVDVR